MSEDTPLDLERVMGLVSDVMAFVMQGVPTIQAAELMLVRAKPSARELTAARQQNQKVHGGGTPEILRSFFQPTPVPVEILRIRQKIDEILVAAEKCLALD